MVQRSAFVSWLVFGLAAGPGCSPGSIELSQDGSTSSAREAATREAGSQDESPDARSPDGTPRLDAAKPDATRPDAASDAGPGACQLPAPGNHTLSLTVDGRSRSYVLHVPAGLTLPLPFVIALHGNGDTAGNFLAYSQLGRAADANGFLLAVPQAISGSGPQGVDWDAYTEPPSTNKDYRFVEEIRKAWEACTDVSRIFLIGYSQGGFLAFYVAMHDADVFGAVHVQSAGNPDGTQLLDGAPRKIPVQLRIGTEDFLLDVARQTRDALQARGFFVDYQEIPNHGHCCYLASLNQEIWAFFQAHPLN